MKPTALILALCFAVSCFAKPKKWLHGYVMDHAIGSIGSLTTGSANGNANATAVGNTAYAHSSVFGMAFSRSINANYYHISFNGITYLVGCIPGTLLYKCPDITVHSGIYVYVDGTHLHVIDDENHDRKMPILEKVKE